MVTASGEDILGEGGSAANGDVASLGNLSARVLCVRIAHPSYPETPSIVRDLGGDLPLFDERVIDALVTLESVIQSTRRDLEQRTAQGAPVSAMFGVGQVVQRMGHDMEIPCTVLRACRTDAKIRNG
jgi:hypothetical protein